MSGQTEIMWGEEVLAGLVPEENTQEEWKQTTLTGLIEVQNGYAFKSEDFSLTEGIPVVKIKNIASGELTLNGLQYYPHSVDKLSRFFIRKGDILIAMTGSHANQPSSIVGKVAKYDQDDFALLNQRVGKIYSVDEEVLDNDFIYWFFKQWDVTFELAVSAGGSANQANISTAQIKALELELPPILEQHAIASVLSSLDDKIDLLHRQNATLEALAETLFRQWFVEEAKEEWEEGLLGDFFTLQRGFDLPIQDRVPGKFPIITSSGYSAGHHEYKVKGPGVVTGRSGVIGKVFYVLEDFWPLNTSLFIKEYKLGTPLFSYFTLKFADLESFNAGSAVPTLNRNHVHAHVAAIPPKELIEAFEKMAYPHFEKMYKNTKQIQTLSNLRDTLLPKLMSGEVRVAY